MTPRGVDDILNDALDIEPSMRSAFLDRECAGHPELRRDIESLLRVHESFPRALHFQRPVHAGGPAEAIPTGTRLGRYAVLHEVGRGGMGVVYEAEDVRLRRRVALKVLPERFAESAEWRERFEREAQLLAALNHPNIATIHALEKSDGFTFLIMELVAGASLGERIGSGRLSADDVLDVSRQIASALEAAHQQGIVHCDLKPANIRITPENRVKLIDFGLARSPTEPRRSEFIMGTPGYMSPEQVEGGEIDHRADIWAYGCVLFTCLSGRAPFEADTPYDTMQATLTHTPSFEELPGDTPAPIISVIRRCMERDVTKRLRSIRIARAEVEQLIALRTLPAAARGRKGDTGSPHRLPVRFDRLIGRERERDDVRKCLEENRVVTLTGSGGSGKTRLALAVAESIAADMTESGAGSVVWVDLAAIVRSDELPGVCATALGVRESAGLGLEIDSQLENHFRGASVLLVMDNAEHVLEASRQFVNRHVTSSNTVRVLVTSREPLSLPGEQVYRVPVLPEAEAIDLFLCRVGSLASVPTGDPAIPDTVARICRQLDGIPLAIELAARRARFLPLSEIDQRLRDRLPFLTAGPAHAVPRHRTLAALFDWSYELLSPPEQQLFAAVDFQGRVRARCGGGSRFGRWHRTMGSARSSVQPGRQVSGGS